ncbi:MAG: hypothetical protein KGK00_05900 [Paracoccaceae bacterium]|nr:hypothetical protein [Paracoccaceae bacterium]MDE3237832.1 hypothetical protein [Paracoccaceae bacterium]
MTDSRRYQTISHFIRAEDGAVTVDWVVLTAAVIGIGMLFIVPVITSTTSATTKVGDYIGATKVTLGQSK